MLPQDIRLCTAPSKQMSLWLKSFGCGTLEPLNTINLKFLSKSATSKKIEHFICLICRQNVVTDRVAATTGVSGVWPRLAWACCVQLHDYLV